MDWGGFFSSPFQKGGSERVGAYCCTLTGHQSGCASAIPRPFPLSHKLLFLSPALCGGSWGVRWRVCTYWKAVPAQHAQDLVEQRQEERRGTRYTRLFLVYSLNQFMKPLPSGELKTTGISFLLQCTQNTLLPFCCLSLVCHLLLSPLLGTSPSQSTLNSFVFPCSPPSLMSSFTDVSSDLFHLYLFLSSRLKQTELDSWSSHRTRKLPGCHKRKHWHVRQGTTDSWHEIHAWALQPWETWPNGLKHGTGKGVVSQEEPWVLLYQDVQECRLRLGIHLQLLIPLTVLTCSAYVCITVHMASWEWRGEVLAVELGLWLSRILAGHLVQITLS